MALNTSVRGGGPSAEFLAWLGPTLNANYGNRFVEYGFDSVEVLCGLTPEQVDRMLTKFVLIKKPGHRFLFLNKLDALRGGREALTAARATAAAPPQQLTRSAVAPSALRRASAVLDVGDGATVLSSALSSFSQRPRIQRHGPVVEASPPNMIRRVSSISSASTLFDPMSDPLVVVGHPIDPMDEPDQDFYHGHQRVIRSGSTIDEAGTSASAPHDDDLALGKSALRGAAKRPKSNKAVTALQKPTSPTQPQPGRTAPDDTTARGTTASATASEPRPRAPAAPGHRSRYSSGESVDSTEDENRVLDLFDDDVTALPPRGHGSSRGNRCRPQPKARSDSLTRAPPQPGRARSPVPPPRCRPRKVVAQPVRPRVRPHAPGAPVLSPRHRSSQSSHASDGWLIDPAIASGDVAVDESRAKEQPSASPQPRDPAKQATHSHRGLVADDDKSELFSL
jgi:hypothetical protein